MQEQWVSRSLLERGKSYQQYEFTRAKVKLLIKLGIFTEKEINGVIKIPMQQVEEQYQRENNIKQKYIPLEQFLAIYNEKLTKSLKKCFLELGNNGELDVIEVPYFIIIEGEKHQIFISLTDVNRIQTEYINTKQALEMISLDSSKQYYSYLSKLANKHKIDEIKTTVNNINLRFYKRSGIEKYVAYKNSFQKNRTTMDGYYNAKQCMRVLDLTRKSWDAVRIEEKLDKHMIHTKSNVQFFPCKIIEELKVKQEQLLSDSLEKNYTNTQVRELLNNGKPLNDNDKRLKLKGEPVPALLNPFFKQQDKFWFYPKEKVDEIVEQRKLRESTNVQLDNDYQTFQYQIDAHQVILPNILRNTEKLWYAYIKNQLLTPNKQNELTTRKWISRYLKCTKHLTQLPKEIYSLTSKEITLLLFMDRVPEVHQQIYYQFLKEVYDEFKQKKYKVYNISQIPNPFQNRAKTKRKKGIYEYEDYLKILQFANKTDFHRKKAITDIELLLNGDNRNYSRYDSAWLYILIHLNNPWRHQDIVSTFPRINIETFGITDITWFNDNQVSFELAQKIIRQVKRKIMIHNKTGAKRYFFCSEELAISFATAIILCELRVSYENPLRSSPIDFKTKYQRLSESKERMFFENLSKAIKFKSLKMNRSLISYMYSIVKDRANGNEMEIAKFFRGHYDFETTNIYIEIPQSQIDFLTSQLFDRDNFGYIPKMFSEVLYGESEDTKEKTHNSQLIKQNFGNIYKVEATSAFLNHIQTERDSVSNIIREMSQEELEERQFQLQTFQLPSKEEDFQCLVAQTGCMYPGRDCDTCPFSIPHFYALSSISDSFVRKLVFLMEEFEKLEYEAEKVKFVNLFHKDMMLIQDAIKRYGKEEVLSFMNLQGEEMNLLLKNLPSISGYITNKEG
ncbi:hypothetical protein [Virgibacillus senegalensis]|uniref:hypothetical protein n=1 Tax=Virgibacillus senegalensis TaxID=1499679 RepID=UPI00069FA44A|nr:hypothetical protein [Virgibacillus senegalensis]